MMVPQNPTPTPTPSIIGFRPALRRFAGQAKVLLLVVDYSSAQGRWCQVWMSHIGVVDRRYPNLAPFDMLSDAE